MSDVAEDTLDKTCRLIATRLRHRMATRDISASQLAKNANLRPSFLYDIISGKSTNPSIVKLARIAEELDVSLTYLIHAESSEGDTSNTSSPGMTPADNSCYITLSALDSPSGSDAKKRTNTARHHNENNASSPAALCFQRQWLQATFRAPPNALRVHPILSSCMSPTLERGDTVIVNTADTHISPPGIFVLYDGVALVTKRLQIIPGRAKPFVHILSDNTQFPAVEKPLNSVEIVGRVVWSCGLLS